MKKKFFYALLVLQIIVVSLIGLQYYLIDEFGVTVKLTAKATDYMEFHSFDDQTEVFVNFDINTIDGSDWKISKELDNNSKIYVLLEAGKDGIYHAVRASTENISAEEDQLVIAGKYQYYNSVSGLNYVNYGMEQIRNTGQFESLSSNEEWVVTLKVAPWGQKKLMDIQTAK